MDKRFHELNLKISIDSRTMTRTKYVTSFKEVFETQYGCCPGFHGDNCDQSKSM